MLLSDLLPLVFVELKVLLHAVIISVSNSLCLCFAADQDRLHALESRIDDVQSLCNKRRSSLRRRVGSFDRPVQAVQPEPMTSSTFYLPTAAPQSTTLSLSSTPCLYDGQQQASGEDHRKWKRPSLKAKVSVRLMNYETY